MSSAVVLTTVKAREKKAKIIDEIKEYIKKYNVIGIGDLTNIGSYEIQLLRSKLRKKALMKVTKNTLFSIAFKQIKSQEEYEKIKSFLQGQNIFIFTDMNPFELSIFLERNMVPSEAKPGDIAPNDIIIPAGNTGFTPGPILSKFGKLKIPTKIEEGAIIVTKDTVVVKRGEQISSDVIEILNKLGIKPMLKGLTLKAVYFDGYVITKEQLKLDIENTKKQIQEGYIAALNLAINSAYPTHETITVLINIAHTNALNLAINATILTKETIPLLIAIANAKANTLSKLIPSS
ncbi:MAG: 50S ribosomal protein L10 [Thermoprotei archaeon]|jgi:large subunit ribosomal protein L10